MEPTQSKLGGRRKGAGRPPLPAGEKLKKHDVMLSDEHVRKAKAIGNGEMGPGIRRALELHGLVSPVAEEKPLSPKPQPEAVKPPEPKKPSRWPY